MPRSFLRRLGAPHDPRLPPGQYDTGSGFPVLTAEVAPRLAIEDWTFRVDGLVEAERMWTWPEVQQLPPSTYEGDIHCVTTWSKLGTSFSGVSVDTFLDAVGVRPQATHVVAWSSTGYTTNLPLEHVRGGKAWVVWEHEGHPLPREHGGPVRLLDHDEPGFWETRGYHALGDPWLEQRYDGD